ncbi:hypothetical protein WKI65_42660 [Streptomyces sp. MS1.AVA.3]|uniref:hypothetical protein n=1 Tax=Streptomyces decoyicus TaxID=249567 RepID=UPI0030C2443F
MGFAEDLPSNLTEGLDLGVSAVTVHRSFEAAQSAERVQASALAGGIPGLVRVSPEARR